MKCIGDHTYIIGVTKQVKLTSEQSRAIHLTSARVFFRLYKDEVLYHANQYSKSSRKCKDTICTLLIMKTEYLLDRLNFLV